MHRLLSNYWIRHNKVEAVTDNIWKRLKDSRNQEWQLSRGLPVANNFCIVYYTTNSDIEESKDWICIHEPPTEINHILFMDEP